MSFGLGIRTERPVDLIAERPDAPFPVDRAELRYYELQRSSVLAISQMAWERDFWQLVAIAGWLVAATLEIVKWL